MRRGLIEVKQRETVSQRSSLHGVKKMLKELDISGRLAFNRRPLYYAVL